MVTFLEPDAAVGLSPGAPGRSLRRSLTVLIVVAALVLVGGVGYVLGSRGPGSTPSATSVDAGFAQDMTVHHIQAVTMAAYTRDHTTDPVLKVLADDIATSQFNQVGEFQGWLDAWALPLTGTQPQMTWMAGSGHVHLSAAGQMPGMATPAQLNKLQTLTGKALDVDFLQLMIYHHQGGLPMAQWAAAHASKSYVRNIAEKIIASQTSEVITMEGMLRALGASPLTPPE